MRCSAWLLLAFALSAPGCSFRVSAECAGCDVPPIDAAIDAARDAPDAQPDAVPDAPGDADVLDFCDSAGGDLIACFELEGSVQDGSLNAIATTTNAVTFVSGKLGMAARIGATSTISIPENSLLDPTAITIEAWINPSQLPAAGTRAGIADNNGQYGFFLQPGGALQCIGLTATANIAANVWTHVACTYDGTTRLYAGGIQVGATAGGGGNLGSGGTTGTSIAGDNPSGSPLNGDIDQLRIFKRARTAAEICAAADLAVCPSSAP